MDNFSSQSNKEILPFISSEMKTVCQKEKKKLNQDPNTKIKSTKDYKTCDYQQSSQERSNQSDKSWLSEQKKNSSYSDIKCQKQKKARRRSGNTVSSNSVRDLKHCMRSLFWSNQRAYQKIQSFQKSHQIKSQIWGVDAFLFLILYLKDSSKQIAEQKYTTLLNLLISKLQTKKQNTTENQSKQKISSYMLHIQEYKGANFYSFWNSQFQRNLNKFFDNLVSRRRVEVSKSIKKVNQIFEELQESQAKSQLQQKIQEEGQQNQSFEFLLKDDDHDSRNQDIPKMENQFDQFFFK